MSPISVTWFRDLTVKHFSDENLFIKSAFIVNKEYPLSHAARNFLRFHGVEGGG